MGPWNGNYGGTLFPGSLTNSCSPNLSYTAQDYYVVVSHQLDTSYRSEKGETQFNSTNTSKCKVTVNLWQ